VGRDVGRHADGDAAGAVDEKVRKPRRQDRGLAALVVIGGLEVDRFLVEVGQQRRGGARQPRFGVAHGRRRIAVHRTEIALPRHQRQAHREILRQAHEGVVDRAVAVRMEVTHHLADDLGRLAERPVGAIAAGLHAVEDAAVDRLEAVAHVGKCARHDHAHGVIEIRAPHLLFDRDGGDVERLGGRRRLGQFRSLFRRIRKDRQRRVSSLKYSQFRTCEQPRSR
jgi:hypothetical protein